MHFYPKNSKKRNIIIQPFSQYKYTTPIPSNNTSSKFIHFNNINLLRRTKDIMPRLILILKELESSKKEKHPKDSVKKNMTNKNLLNNRIIKLQKNLKSSLSQGIFENKKVKFIIYP